MKLLFLCLLAELNILLLIRRNGIDLNSASRIAFRRLGIRVKYTGFDFLAPAHSRLVVAHHERAGDSTVLSVLFHRYGGTQRVVQDIVCRLYGYSDGFIPVWNKFRLRRLLKLIFKPIRLSIYLANCSVFWKYRQTAASLIASHLSSGRNVSIFPAGMIGSKRWSSRSFEIANMVQNCEVMFVSIDYWSMSKYKTIVVHQNFVVKCPANDNFSSLIDKYYSQRVLKN